MASMTFRRLVRSLMRNEQETKNVKPSADMLDRVYINNQTGETVICRAVLDDIVIIEKMSLLEDKIYMKLSEVK